MSPDQHEPLLLFNGTIKASDAFKTCKPLKEVMNKVPGAREHAKDIAFFLYFVYSSRSLYKQMPLRDRERSTLEERIGDPEWMSAAKDTPEMKELVTYFQRIALTPGQRLYFALSEQMMRLADEFSTLTGETDPAQLSARIKLSKELLKSEREIQAMISEESVRVNRGGYEAHFMEVPPGQR